MPRDPGMRAEEAPQGHGQGSASQPCAECGGTGLVCGVTPVIDSRNCCADYANAVCPKCRGRGVVKRDE